MSSMLRALGLIVGAVFVAVFVAAGLAVAAALLPLLVGLGAMAAFGALCVRQELRETARGSLAVSPVRLAVGVAGGVIVLIYTAIGMTTVLGGAVTALAGVTGLAWLARRRFRPGATENAEPASGDRPRPAEIGSTSGVRCAADDARDPEDAARTSMPADPATLSIDELCRAWRVSYLLLERSRVPADLDRASSLRRRYLDELARRDPVGFRRWLDDGARAASDPSRYLRHRPDPPQHDQDQAA